MPTANASPSTMLRAAQMVSHPQPGMLARAPYDPRRGPMRTLRSIPPARHGGTVGPASEAE